MLVVFVGLAALAVDVGLAFSRRTALQAATDMAVLGGGWQLPVTTNSGFTLPNPTTPAGVTSATTAGLSANGFSGAAVAGWPTIGLYTPTPATPAASRYVAGASRTSTIGANVCTSKNAVQLRSQTTSPTFFGGGNTPFSPVAGAAAVRNVGAAFRVGSGLASFGPSGVINGVLGGLLGSTLTLSLVDYSNLADLTVSGTNNAGASVNGLLFANALATQLNVTAGTYSSLLASTVTISQIISAELSVLSGQGSISSVAVTSLTKLQQQLNLTGQPSVTIGSLLDLGIWDSQPIGTTSNAALTGTLNVLDLVSYAAQVADGSNFLRSGGTISIPGLATITLSTAIIEPPQAAPYYQLGQPCATAQTSQVKVNLSVTLLQGLTLPLLGTFTLLSIPISITVANGTASLLTIDCPTSAAPQTTGAVLAAQGSVANVTLGPATLLNVLNLITITVNVPAQILSGATSSPQTLQFSSAISGDQTKSFSYSAFSGVSVGSILYTALSGASALTISVLGLPILTVKTDLLNILAGILVGSPSVIDSVLQGVFSALGLTLGNVTVFASNAVCRNPVLVQ